MYGDQLYHEFPRFFFSLTVNIPQKFSVQETKTSKRNFPHVSRVLQKKLQIFPALSLYLSICPHSLSYYLYCMRKFIVRTIELK